jgi:hypothetical protein
MYDRMYVYESIGLEVTKHKYINNMESNDWASLLEVCACLPDTVPPWNWLMLRNGDVTR